MSSKRQEITSAGEGMKKREILRVVGRKVNWYSHYGKQLGKLLKKLKIEIPFDPAIILLGVYIREIKT